MQGVIVVAESSRTVRKMVEYALACHPFQLEFVGDGQAALNAVAQFSPKLVLIDINLPGLNAYQVAAQIQSAPVILLVGRNYQLDMDQARNARVVGHLVTPFLTQKLVEMVYSALGMKVADEEAKLFREIKLPPTGLPLANNQNVGPGGLPLAKPLAPNPSTQASQPAAAKPAQPAAAISSAQPAAAKPASNLPAQQPISASSRPAQAAATPSGLPTGARVTESRPPLPSPKKAPARAGLQGLGTTAKANTPSSRPIAVGPSPWDKPRAAAPQATEQRPEMRQAPVADRVSDALPVTRPIVDPKGVAIDPSSNEILKAAVASVTEKASAQLKDASSDLIERIAWEVIPKLADAILKEEIARLVRAKLA